VSVQFKTRGDVYDIQRTSMKVNVILPKKNVT